MLVLFQSIPQYPGGRRTAGNVRLFYRQLISALVHYPRFQGPTCGVRLMRISGFGGSSHSPLIGLWSHNFTSRHHATPVYGIAGACCWFCYLGQVNTGDLVIH